MLVTARGTRYEPTSEDVLWLARAVEVEGQPRELVAQTLVNGFLWAKEAFHSHRTLAEWVRAYAQPVSPLWMPGGEMYEKALASARSDAERERIRSAGWRRQQEHATRVAFSPDTQKAVQTALSAPPRLPGAVDYAAPTLEHHEPWVAFTPKEAGRNRFWARPGAVGWTGYAVDGANTLPLPATEKSWLPWLAIAGVGGWLWTKRK